MEGSSSFGAPGRLVLERGSRLDMFMLRKGGVGKMRVNQTSGACHALYSQHAQSSYNDNTSKQSFGYATSNARAGGNGAHSPQPPQRSTAVNRQVYEQVAASRNRLSKQLSAKNKYIRHLEASLEERTQAVEVAYQALLQVRRELESVQRLSELTSAAAKFGLDKVDIANRSERVAKRAETLQQGMEKTLAGVDQLVIRRVPVVWYGLATDVRLVGDFDSWTEGFSLSPDEIQDQTFTKFSAEVPLRPGTYLVKFKVDNTHWRLAPDWPMQEGEDGNTNNILVVP